MPSITGERLILKYTSCSIIKYFDEIILICSFPSAFEINGKVIIAVQIPLTSQVHKTRGDVFLRSEDGDYKVRGQHQLTGLMNRKLGMFTEQRPLPVVTVNDLKPDLFDRARRLIRSNNTSHLWADLSDEGRNARGNGRSARVPG